MEAPYAVDKEEMQKRFTYHAPKGDQADRYKTLRDAGGTVADIIGRMCPESREKALALTNLEQAIMWANAAIARRE